MNVYMCGYQYTHFLVSVTSQEALKVFKILLLSLLTECNGMTVRLLDVYVKQEIAEYAKLSPGFAFADFEARRMGLGVGGGGCDIKTEANMCIQNVTDFGWFWIELD